jgi:hypothetical protein
MSDFVGGTIGDYRLEAAIGAGRAGEVFRASHVRFESVRVAIRIFDPKIVDARGFKARFFEFAQAAGTIVHANLVRVRESGEDDRRWFVAMDLMSGTLEALRPDPATAEWQPALWKGAECIRQAAEGVAAAHDAGLVHGGIHLRNLFLADGTAAAPQVKVGDLGIATLVPVDGEWPSRERDVFALGVALYALTTGRDPFPRSAAGDAAVASPRRLVRGYPDALETIVVRCLASDPRDRFPSCAALATALRDAGVAANFAESAAAIVARPGAAPPPAVANLTAPVPATKQAAAPPRPAPTIKPGSQGVPVVHVLDSAGNRVDMEYLRNTGLRLGRADDNDIVLKSTAVSLQHGRIDWVDNRITVTDLGSTNNTLLRGARLLPQVPQEWDGEQWLQIGPYWLWLELAPDVIDYKNRIEVTIDQRGRSMTITPGKPSTFRVTLSNQTTVIQQVEVSVEGVPGEWVQGTSTRRHVPPLEQRDIDLVVTVPRSPEGRAGTYTATIRVHSFTDPTMDQGAAVGTWTVEPFEAAKLLLTPSKASGVLRASYTVALHNDGNRPLTYAFTAADNDRRLECLFSAEGYPSSNRLSLEVGEGQRATVRLQVQTAKRWFGSTSTHNFAVEASPNEGRQDAKTEGHFLHRAVFPVWAIAVAPLLLIALLMLVPWMMRPEVRTVSLEPLNPRPGETFTVFWDAPRARDIRVLVNEVPIRPDPQADAGMLTFANGLKTDSNVKVVGSNLFGQAIREVPVRLSPPDQPLAPLIEASIDTQEVSPGGAVTLTWNATRAERVEFSHRGSVGLSGTFTDHPTEPQTYVLSAFNSAGVEVKKTFPVQVRQPPVAPGMVRLTASSRDRKRDKPNFEVNQGRSVFFDWDAPNAVEVRLEGGGTTLTLQGTSGRARRAQLRGKGHYSFRLIAKSQTGQEVVSQPVEVDVTCTAFQVATKRCKGTPEVRW